MINSRAFELSKEDGKKILNAAIILIVGFATINQEMVKQFLSGMGLSQSSIILLLAFVSYVGKQYITDNTKGEDFIMDGSEEIYGEDDFLLEGDEAITLLEKLAQSPQGDKEIYSYDQQKDNRTRSACTLYGPVGVVSSMWNIRLTQEQLMDMWIYGVTYAAYKEGEGKFFVHGVDTVRNRWNERFPDKKVVSFRTKQGSAELEACFDKGYGAVGGYQGNSSYNADRRDGILDGTSFGTSTYGHCTSCRKYDNKYYVHDSSAQYPVYEVKNRWDKIRGWYQNAYVFLPETTLPEGSMYLNKLMAANGNEYNTNAKSKKYKKLLNDLNNLVRDYYGVPRVTA